MDRWCRVASRGYRSGAAGQPWHWDVPAMPGFLYVMSNPSMFDPLGSGKPQYKIGFSVVPQTRADQGFVWNLSFDWVHCGV